MKVLCAVAACIATAIIVLMLVFLLMYAYPAIRFNGMNFLTGVTWNIGNQYGSTTITRNGYTAESGASFGALVFVAGTLATATVAMIIAVPLSLLVALALVYRTPPALRPFVNSVVELMAGVPSVVYGLWGMVVLVPVIGRDIGPWTSAHLGSIPFLGGEPGSGNGLLAASLILALMAMPFMVATVRDVMLAQEKSIFEASMALGSTSWQAVTKAVLPSVRSGVFAAVLVALGRALGETMAVLMVCGGAVNIFAHNIFQSVNTIAAVIVSQLESALTDASGMAQRSLAELALLLFVITLLVNIIARVILRGADRFGEAQ